MKRYLISLISKSARYEIERDSTSSMLATQLTIAQFPDLDEPFTITCKEIKR